jgi:hypothetical protein
MSDKITLKASDMAKIFVGFMMSNDWRQSRAKDAEEGETLALSKAKTAWNLMCRKFENVEPDTVTLENDLDKTITFKRVVRNNDKINL